MAPILFAVGVLSILAQVVLIRELSVAAYGNDLIYTLALGCWLLWTAAGAVAGRRRARPSAAQVCALLLLFPPALVGSVVFIRGSHQIFAGIPGAYLAFPLQLLSLGLGLLPIGLLLGFLFQRAAASYVLPGRTLAAAYAIESSGGILGGAGATLALRWGTSVLSQALLCALLAALLVFVGYRRRIPRWQWFTAGGMAGLLVLGLFLAGPLDRTLTGWTHPDLVATADTPYGRVTVTSSAGQTIVYENNALAFDTEGTGAEEFVHLAALQVETPRRILVVGGGAEGLVREALKHHPEALVSVHLDELLLELVADHLPSEDRRSLEAASVETVIADPRSFLGSRARYDLILIGMPEPSSGQTGRYYSREFFELCAARLEPGGVLALRLPSSENLWTRALVLRTASIFNALRAPFADVLILPGTTNILLASDRSLVRTPGVLAERFRQRGIHADLVGPQYLEYLLTNDRLFQIRQLMEAAPSVIHTDTRPVGYQHSQMVWLSQFFPSLANLDPTPAEAWSGDGAGPRWAAVWVVIVIAFVLLRRRQVLRRATQVAVAGFLGMVLESVVILNYQVQKGVLYQDLGLLLTLFMAGLALGSAAVGRIAASRDRRIFASLRAGLPSALVLFSAAVAWALEAGRMNSLAGAGLCLLLVGSLVGGILAHASLDGAPDQGEVIAPLYAADLIGGSAGSVVATLFLLPVLGLGLSAWSAAGLGFTALVLLPRRWRAAGPGT